MELEFEKPIKELEKKVSEMKRIASEDSDVDIAPAIKSLEEKL